jgi:integrase
VSTKQTDRKAAQKIADEFATASRKAMRGELTTRQVRKVLADIYELVNPEPLSNDSVRSFFTNWIAAKKITTKQKTYARYAGIVTEFLRWLGPIGETLLPYLSSTTIAKFRDHLAKKHSPSSVNIALACIQTALQQAFDDNLVDVNEAERVKRLPGIVDRPQERRPFTDDELRAILAVADTEWRGMTLCGLYHGLRLGDVASLCWTNVVLEARELRFKTEKANREMVIPIAEPFYRYLLEIAGDDARGPLFPRACALRQRKVATSALSNQFYRLMTEAGVVEKRTNKKKKTGLGRSGRRESGGLGFHCLRHTATTLLKRAGASDVVAREIIGHDTAAVSRTYSHIDTATLRDAIDKMPDLT